VGAQALARGLPLHRARLVPVAGDWAGRRAVAFAGIGIPQKFFSTLRAAGAEIAATRAFPDHHRYSAKDLSGLAAEAARLGAELVTTEKDAVRLPTGHGVRTLPVRLVFADAAAIRAQIGTLAGG
jgi:tetraacyldisaccharide 4'-kinase